MTRKSASAFGLAAVVLLVAGCNPTTSQSGSRSTGGGTTATAVDSGLQGNVVIDGSSTVYPISEAVAASFRESNKEVKVTVGVSGTGGGFKRFTKGETDISDASRPIKSSEFEQCKVNTVRFVEAPVAYDGLTIVVNNNNAVDQMTVDELKKIFRSPGAKTWKEVNDAWPDKPIKIYSPGTDSGTFDYFKEVIIGKDETASIRDDMSVSEDDNVLVTGVKREQTAIGFFGAAYYFENKDELKAVKIVNPKTKTAVAPDPAAIESGEYAPFSRPLFIYVNVSSMKQPQVKKFVNYYLDKAAEMATKVGYVPLPKEVYDEARAHLDNRLSGTHYLTKEGEKKSGALPDLYKESEVFDFE